MSWNPIGTVTTDDTPFIAWIEPWGDPAENAASIAYDCALNAAGDVVDADGNTIANVTHWRAS